jgi:hypothetical protein
LHPFQLGGKLGHDLQCPVAVAPPTKIHDRLGGLKPTINQDKVKHALLPPEGVELSCGRSRIVAWLQQRFEPRNAPLNCSQDQLQVPAGYHTDQLTEMKAEERPAPR